MYKLPNEHNKWCNKCKKFLSNKLFHKNKHMRNGLDAYCKECGNSSKRRRYLRDKFRFNMSFYTNKKEVSMKTVLLVDVSNLVYRGHYKTPYLTNSAGDLSAGFFNFWRILNKVRVKIHPSKVILVFDSYSKRKVIFSSYKGHREKTPEVLQIYSQINSIYRISRSSAYPIKGVGVLGLEADDILSALADHYSKKYRVVILTRDSDLQQCVSDRVQVYDDMNNLLIDKNYVFERWGGGPGIVVDTKVLTGDKSDGIPGIVGIGPKKSLKLLQTVRQIVFDMGENSIKYPLLVHYFPELWDSPLLPGILMEHRDIIERNLELILLPKWSDLLDAEKFQVKDMLLNNCNSHKFENYYEVNFLNKLIAGNL